MEVEKGLFFPKKNPVREKITIFLCWEVKLKMKNGRFWLEKKDCGVASSGFMGKSTIPERSRGVPEAKTSIFDQKRTKIRSRRKTV